MENKSTALDKAVKVSIIAGALIIALSVAYYLVIFLPKKYELTTRQDCADKAKTKAIEALKSKIEIMQDYWKKEEMKKALEQGLYIKTDYDSSYESCLSIKGLKK